MKPKPKKSFLSNYGPGVKVMGGAVVLTTVIICGFVAYKAIKTNDNSTTMPATQSTQTTTTKKANYDGRYVGNTSVANGLSSADVNVVGSSLSGTAVYNNSVFNGKIGLKVTGTVDANGKESGSFSGSGTIGGRSVTVNGTYSGQITNKTMNISYKATASGLGLSHTYPGNIALYKQ